MRGRKNIQGQRRRQRQLPRWIGRVVDMSARYFYTCFMASLTVSLLSPGHFQQILRTNNIPAAWQTCVYWFIGAMINNGHKLANFAGFYKGIQSASAVIVYRVDALKAPFINKFASSWSLLVGSLLLAASLIWAKIQDTVSIEEDLKFTDETFEDFEPTIVGEPAPEVEGKV